MPVHVSTRSRVSLLVAGAVSVVLAVSGCSSSSKPPAQSSTAGSAGATSKAPLKIMIWGSYSGPSAFPEYLSSAKAAVAGINAAGGVNGRTINLLSCDFAGDPNKQTGCVQKAISEKVSAVVSTETYLQTGPVYKALAAAGIPDIGGSGISNDELSSPIHFGLASLAVWAYGEAKVLVDAGAKHIAIISCKDVPGCLAEQKFFIDALKTLSNGSSTVTRTVLTSITTTDMTAAAADAARGNVDGVAGLQALPTQTVSMVRGLRQQGFKGPIVTEDALVQPSVVKALGDLASGVQVVHLAVPVTDTANAGVSHYLADMKAYQPSSQLDDGGLLAWWGVQVYAQIAKQASGTDAAAILKAAQNLKVGSIVTGVTPPLPAAETSPVSDYPSFAFNPFILALSGNGTNDANPKFINAFVK